MVEERSPLQDVMEVGNSATTPKARKKRTVWPSTWRMNLVTWFANLCGVKIEIRYSHLV